ncbi:MAG: MotA/TolQ/ExbB proton channel family protein [Pseudomonadota bacterium]
MLKFSKTLKVLGAAALLSLGPIAAPAVAQQDVSLSDILARVRADSEQLSQENQRRLREFQEARDEQEAIMATARSELAAVEARARNLNAQFEANQSQLDELQFQLETEAGDFGELLGQFRTAAGETMPVIENSLANFHYPGRVEKLSQISQASALPSRGDLDSLPKAILQEMIAQSEVTTFTANVSNGGSNGENAELDLMRVGTFTAATTDGTRFVEVSTEGSEPRISAFASPPGGIYRSGMRSLINANEGQVVRAPVDPTRGDLLAIFGNTLGVWEWERFQQGGFVGYVILFFILPLGLVLGLFKIFSLFTMGAAMGSTAKSKSAGTGNPLARVFEAYEAHRNDDIETLELKLDEQILKETPKIERFNDIVKVLAAVAPLAGLLGTVVGMIRVFTAITNYGTGDPQIMAGGISEALVTTMLGLVAAVPLLLIGSIASSMARSNQQVLDEQAAGLVAERAERGGAA